VRVALGAACRAFAQSPDALPAQRDSDWREARAAAQRALDEIAAIPGSSTNPLYRALLTEARELIAAEASSPR
jgi:hypothetical protein